MKRLIGLTLALIISTTTAFVAFAEDESSIGKINDSSGVPRLEIDIDKLSEQIKKEKSQAQSNTKNPVKITEPVIVLAENLPVNDVKQHPYNPENFGNSVTITKTQLMKTDVLVMEGLAIRNLRKIATHPEGGDIYAIDMMKLEKDWNKAGSIKETELRGNVQDIKIKMNNPLFPKNPFIGNLSTNVPSYKGEEFAYSNAMDLQRVVVGKWYTYVIGNNNKLGGGQNKNTGYSTKDLESVIIPTKSYSYLDEKGLKHFLSSKGKATQLVIEWK